MGFKMFSFTHSRIYLLNDCCVPGTIIDSERYYYEQKYISVLYYNLNKSIKIHTLHNIDEIVTVFKAQCEHYTDYVAFYVHPLTEISKVTVRAKWYAHFIGEETTEEQRG